MPKNKRRESGSKSKQVRQNKPKHRISGGIRWTTHRGLAITALFAVVLTSGLAATRIFGSRQERTQSTVAPADALNPSREYVYLGSNPIAVEEGTGSGGSGCSYSLTPTSNPNVQVAGGQFQLTVNTTSGCAWSASSNVPWITFPSGSTGSGMANLIYNVAASTNPASQTGTITIANQQFPVTQAGTSCMYSVSTSNPPPFSASGGNSSFGVTAGTGCTWTATSTQNWVTITAPPGGSGSANGTVSYTVAQNTGNSVRTAMINVADKTVTITQAGSCTYTISPTSAGPFAASGGTGTISVTPSDSSCSWGATSSANFITLTGASGTQCSGGICGNGFQFYSVAANPTTQTRSGTITVAGQLFTITQDAGCALSFSPGLPPGLNFPAAGATESVTITESGASNCGWSATAVDNWITVNSPTSGTGSGAVSLTVGQNPNTTPRSGVFAITSTSGFTYNYTVTQDGSTCGFQVSPTTINPTQSGGTFNNGIQVTTGSNCSWTAGSNASWILIVGGNGGPVNFTGSAQVSYIVSANSGASARTGTMTIAGVIVTVNQPGSCTYSLSSSSQSFQASAGTGSFTVNTQSGCSWTATSNASWITITSGSSGSTTGTVNYSVAANTGTGSRSGSITAAGLTFNISQAGVPSTCPNVSTFSGTGVYGYLEGNPTTAKWANPNSVATAKEPAGANAVFIADTDNSRIRMVYIDGANAGQSVLLAGNGTAGYSPPASDATTVSINGPRGLAALTNSGGVVTAIYFADTGNNMIRKLTPPAGGSGPWSIADFSGSGIAGYTDGAASSAQFNSPQGVAVASNGTVYIADASNGFIRALTTNGTASTYAGGPNIGMNTPVGLALSKNTGNLFVSDQGVDSIFSIAPGGSPATRIAGSGAAGFADGTGSAAKFNSPYQVAWGTTTADGEVLYVADRLNQRVRKIVLSSASVVTYSGSGTAGFTDSTCLSAQFNRPAGVAVGPLGELYIADSVNNRIRKVQ